MFIHWKRLGAKGVSSDALVSSLDVYPTLLELAGVEIPEHIQGRSLIPVMDNPGAKVREYVFSECVGVGGKAGEGHRMVRSDRWKYVLAMNDEEYLFDESKDPFEQNNLAQSPEQKNGLKEMRSRLAEWMRSNNDRKPKVDR
jgi:arylsulfatase A-like enzyme